MIEDGLVLFLRRLALRPFLERNEKDAAVGRGHLTEEIEAGDGAHVFDARCVLQNRFTLFHRRVRALERCGVGQEHLHEEIALVFLGQETAGDAFAEHAGEEDHAAEENERDERFADEEMARGDEAVRRHAEHVVEPIEEFLQTGRCSFSSA